MPSANVKQVVESNGRVKIAMSWKARAVSNNTRDKAFVTRMLGDWAQNHDENEGGLSIEKAFRKYDRDENGTIDVSEFEKMLIDLGVEATDERVKYGFAALDVDENGKIDYQEFSRWWRRDEVTYIVKRSEEVLYSPTGAGGSGTSGSSDDMSVKGTAASRANALTKNLYTIPEEDQSISSQRSGNQKPGTRPRSASAVPQRPGGGGKTGTVCGGVRTSAGSSAASRMAVVPARQVACPIVPYRDVKPKCEVRGLTPNRLYHFRLRYVGPRSNSALSAPLVLMTVPTPPTRPVLIDVTATNLRLKWYPGPYGAFKFMVQLFNEGQGGGNGWATIYNGQENVTTYTTLASDNPYRVRVIALNFQGGMSEPSPDLQFRTVRRGGEKDVSPTTQTVSSVFKVECTGDISVGDVILITERLYERKGADFGAEKGGYSTAVSNGVVAGKGGQSTPVRLDTSVTSLQSLGGGSLNGGGSVASLGAATISNHGAFIGERTVACAVIKDNYRSTKTLLVNSPISEKNKEKFWAMWLQGRKLESKNYWTSKEFTNTSLNRTLWLEVVWQKGSAGTRKYKEFDLRPGEVLSRQQFHLEQFEVYRSEWQDERYRRSLLEEYQGLDECFVPVDC